MLKRKSTVMRPVQFKTRRLLRTILVVLFSFTLVLEYKLNTQSSKDYNRRKLSVTTTSKYENVTNRETIQDLVNKTADFQQDFHSHGTTLTHVDTHSTTILDLPSLPFLPDYRNPCWLEPLPTTYPYAGNRLGGKKQGYLSDLDPHWTRLYSGLRAAGHTQRVRCLPHFYIGGFPKCGTTDVYARLMRHPHIAPAMFKEPHYWTRWRFWTDTCFWRQWMCADGERCIKRHNVCDGVSHCGDASDEAHCEGPWSCEQDNGGCSHTCTVTGGGPQCSCPRLQQLLPDRKTCRGGMPLTDYIDLFDPAAEQIRNTVTEDGFHPIVTGEATAATVWDNHRWRDEPTNGNNTEEPGVVTADLIAHITPSVKMVVMVRNPTDRLYSDLLYFRPHATPTSFHSLVTQGLASITKCLQVHSVRACVHEPQDTERPPEGRYWQPVERIRIGLYSEYVKDWLRVLPAGNLKVVRLEDYSARRRQVLHDIVHFLGLDAMPEQLVKAWESEGVMNTGAGKYRTQGGMRNDTRRLLDDFYRPFNRQFAQLMNSDAFLYS